MTHPVNRVPGNPLNDYLSSLKLTRKDFADHSGLSRTYLLRVSQGRASSLSSSVINALREEAQARGVALPGDEQLVLQWDMWVLEHRKAQTIPAPAVDAKLSPWNRLVKATGGVSRMAAILAVPDNVVSRYCKGQSRTMPQPIKEALEDIGYPFTQALEKVMESW